jgi:Flp pilus assembly protein TadB
MSAPTLRSATGRETSRWGGRDNARLAAATALLVAWLLLLLFGHPLGVAVHLLLLAALAVVPWRLLHP